MGNEPENIFFQRKHTDDQQTHDKLLNNTNHQENANQNHNVIPSLTYQNDYYQKGNPHALLLGI